jgi:hypothetical protein
MWAFLCLNFLIHFAIQMADRPDPLPQEIMDAERFIEELMNDSQHPIHHRAHPLHAESVKALDEMMQRLDEMRIEWLSME